MKTLRSKLTFTLLALAIIPLAITTFIILRITTTSLEQTSRDYRVATADYARNLTTSLLENSASELKTIGAALSQSDLSVEDRTRQAKAHLLGAKNIHRVALYSKKGEHLFTLNAAEKENPSLSKVKRLEHIAIDLGSITQKQGFVTLKTQSIDKEFYLPILTPIYRGASKELYAYLWSPIALAPLNKKVATLSKRRFGHQDNRVFIIDHNYTIIVHAYHEALGKSIRDRGLLRDVPANQAPRQDIAYAAQYEYAGEKLLGILSPLSRANYFVVVEQLADEVFRPVKQTWQSALFVGLGFTLIALILGIISGGRLAFPISALAKAAARVAKGNFNTSVTVKGKDEVSNLGHAFNQMTSDLRSFRSELIRETEIRTDLGRYLSPEIVQQVVDGDGNLKLGGERKEITVLFADVVAFTPLAEKHPPEHVVAILNELFTFLTEIVFKHGGIVDKFVGDCVMAVFGAPYQHEDDALRAIRCAEEMLRWIETGNVKWRKDLGRELQLGIGVSTGEAVVGNIGSEKRMEYTVIGDTVNIAARLETLAQPGQILMTTQTANRVDDEFDVISRGMHPITGRSEAIEIFQLDE